MFKKLFTICILQLVSMSCFANFATDRVIVSLKSGNAAKSLSIENIKNDIQSKITQATARSVSVADNSKTVVYKLDEPVSESELLHLIADLNKDPSIYAEVDGYAKADAVPNDPGIKTQWYIDSVALSEAWYITTGNKDLVIAVIDSGIDDHEDLNSTRILPGYDFITDSSISEDGNGRDSDPIDNITDCNESTYSKWHGLHVTGIISAISNNGKGVAGVNSEVKILPVRVIGKCNNGLYSDIADAIRWSAGLPVNGVPINSNPAKIINLSLGGGGQCYAFSILGSAIEDATNAGAIVVAAAGNDAGDAGDVQPANCPHTITVAASNYAGDKATFSNYGSVVEIVAPGTSIYSTYKSWSGSIGVDSYATLTGTSMATPIVSGVVSLILSINQDLTYDEISSILIGTSGPIVDGCSYCKGGIINAKAALDEVLTPTPITKTPTNEPNVNVSSSGGGAAIDLMFIAILFISLVLLRFKSKRL